LDLKIERRTQTKITRYTRRKERASSINFDPTTKQGISVCFAMNGDEKSPPLSTRTMIAMSYLNKIFFSMTLVALGAMGGFGIFHSALQHRIQQTEYSYNVTLAIVTGRFVESEKERDRCIETDEGKLQEIYDLRGRLDAQYKSWYDLTVAHRSIFTKQQENAAQIKQFREAYDRDQRTLASLKVESEEKDSDLIAIQEDLQDYHRTKANLLSELTKMQEAKEEETHDLQVRMQSNNHELESLQQNLNFLSNQKTQIEMESQALQMRIGQKDEEFDSVKKNSDTLQNQKRRLENDVAGMRDKLGKMESQIEKKDKELFEYRDEEGNLEKKLANLREGMLGLLKEKIDEIQDLENHVGLLNQEKAKLELQLDNWREGMLTLVKEKIQEIEQLKAELAESQKSMKTMMHEIELARSEQVETEEFVRERLDIIERDPDPEQEKLIHELLREIEQERSELRESQKWVVAAMKEIEHVKSDQAESEELITEKTNEIKDLRLQIERNQESAKEQISKLETDLIEARKSVEEKTNQIEHLNSDLGEFVIEINGLKSVFAGDSFKLNDVTESTTSETMIDHLQQRDGVMCRQLFGKGPYYVKFVIRLPPDESNGGGGGDDVEYNNTVFFVIELSSRKELPHSTYTFLTLVESNLYNDGVAFLSARDNGGLKIGSQHTPDAMSLEQKLKPLGLTGESSLSFVETSTSGEALPCVEHSFGFVHRGPGLNLFLSEKDDDERSVAENETDCFAQVIRGHENLQKIQSLLLETGELLEIISAKHLRVD